jgi:signal transduction histidine kinase
LPAGIDSAAYRVVQEALTNVSRHAPAATATVQLSYGARELIVQVDDDGRGGPSEDTSGSGSGSGIPGMRERAAALGGRLEAGRMPYGGFRIRATFPLDGGE